MDKAYLRDTQWTTERPSAGLIVHLAYLMKILSKIRTQVLSLESLYIEHTFLAINYNYASIFSVTFDNLSIQNATMK